MNVRLYVFAYMRNNVYMFTWRHMCGMCDMCGVCGVCVRDMCLKMFVCMYVNMHLYHTHTLHTRTTPTHRTHTHQTVNER